MACLLLMFKALISLRISSSLKSKKRSFQWVKNIWFIGNTLLHLKGVHCSAKNLLKIVALVLMTVANFYLLSKEMEIAEIFCQYKKFLYDDSRSDENKNKFILEATLTFMKNSERFLTEQYPPITKPLVFSSVASMASCYLFVTINIVAFSFALGNTEYCSQDSIVYHFLFLLYTHCYKKTTCIYLGSWNIYTVSK